MQKIAIYIPNKDKYGNFVPQYNDKLQELQNTFIDKFGGFSWYEGIGGYKTKEGKVIIEAHRRFEVICECDWATKELIKSLCNKLRKQFKQESILYTIQELESELVYDW